MCRRFDVSCFSFELLRWLIASTVFLHLSSALEENFQKPKLEFFDATD